MSLFLYYNTGIPFVCLSPHFALPHLPSVKDTYFNIRVITNDALYIMYEKVSSL